MAGNGLQPQAPPGTFAQNLPPPPSPPQQLTDELKAVTRDLAALHASRAEIDTVAQPTLASVAAGLDANIATKSKRL